MARALRSLETAWLALVDPCTPDDVTARLTSCILDVARARIPQRRVRIRCSHPWLGEECVALVRGRSSPRRYSSWSCCGSRHAQPRPLCCPCTSLACARASAWPTARVEAVVEVAAGALRQAHEARAPSLCEHGTWVRDAAAMADAFAKIFMEKGRRRQAKPMFSDLYSRERDNRRCLPLRAGAVLAELHALHPPAALGLTSFLDVSCGSALLNYPSPSPS